jgi:hypothetical protein
MVGKRLVNTGVAAGAGIDALQNFETVTYTGNGGTQKITGYIRKGAAFSTNSTYVSLPSNFNLANNSFTISAWFANTKTSGNGYGITSSGSGTSCHTNLHIGRRGSNSKFTFAFFCSDLDSSTNMSTDGTWQHWVCTYDASTNSRKIYLNGTLDASDTAGNDYIGTANLQLGGDTYWGTGNEYKGKLDQVRIFNTAITDSAKISQLAAEDYSKATKSTTDIFNDGTGIALYELDEDASDTGVYTVGQGDIDSGQSADFNGGSEAYNTSVASNLTGDYSFGFYVKFDSLPTEGGLMGIYTPNTSNGTSLAFANGNLLLNCGNSQTATSIPSSFWEVNKWYHIAVTHDNGGDVKLYVNNVLSKTLTTTSTTIQSGSTLILGRSSRTSSGSYNYVQRLDGQMDEVRIYNDVLTSTEVGYLAANDSVNIPTGNLVAHYKLDGNGNDQTNNNYSLTWSGTQLYSTNAEFPFNQYNGTPTNVNFLGMAFQPDLVWVKNRFDINNLALFDSIRGREMLTTSTTNQGFTPPSGYDFTSFDSNGFTVAGSPYYININDLNDSMVAWCFKGGGNSNTYNIDDTGYSTASDAGLSSANGTTLNGASVNTEAGFSIINYETNVNGDNRPAHGLTQEPELIIFKPYDTSSLGWYVMTKKIDGSLDFLFLNTDGVKIDTVNNEFINSTHFRTSFGTSWGSVIAYCFHSVDGYQKVGSYTGLGGTSGPLVDLGFEPRWIMIKGADTTGASNWFIWDYQRDIPNPNNSPLQPNSNAAELTDNTFVQVTFGATNFQVSSSAASPQINELNKKYIYLAIA